MNGLGLIAIAGVVGVGKTTLARNLAELLGAPFIREEYDRNPFLPRLLRGDKTVALPAELFFLLGRARQLDAAAIPPGATAVCDYIFDKNRLFAELTLDTEQLALYSQAERAVLPRIAEPRVVIHLTDTMDNCIARIRRRGRDYEQSITPAWLERLSDAYDRLFTNWQGCPVVRIDVAQLDLRQPRSAAQIADELHRQAVSI